MDSKQSEKRGILDSHFFLVCGGLLALNVLAATVIEPDSWVRDVVNGTPDHK